MDMITSLLARVQSSRELDKTLYAIQAAIAAARSANIPVIYIALEFRKEFPEVNFRNKAFAALRNVLPEGPAQFHLSIAPQPGDIIVPKKRFSAFAGNDLDLILRSQGVDQLVLTGYSTSGVVLSTLREAADKDYLLTVLSDACLDNDAEAHNVLLNKVFPRSAEVLTTSGWASTVTKG